MERIIGGKTYIMLLAKTKEEKKIFDLGSVEK